MLMHINVNAYFKEYKMNLSFEVHDKNDFKVLLVLLFIFFLFEQFRSISISFHWLYTTVIHRRLHDV